MRFLNVFLLVFIFFSVPNYIQASDYLSEIEREIEAIKIRHQELLDRYEELNCSDGNYQDMECYRILGGRTGLSQRLIELENLKRQEIEKLKVQEQEDKRKQEREEQKKVEKLQEKEDQLEKENRQQIQVYKIIAAVSVAVIITGITLIWFYGYIRRKNK